MNRDASGRFTKSDGSPYDPGQDLDEEITRIRTKMEHTVLKAALFYEGRVKELLSGPRSGRIYGVPGHPHIPYQASAPGEPPASPLGDLRKSITHTLPAWEGQDVFSEVGTSLVYARILEFGGLTGRGHLTRILPRPYFAPSWLAAESEIEAILAEAVQS